MKWEAVILIIGVMVMTPLISALTNISDCGAVLNTPDEYYTLNQSLSTDITCITVNASNVILDGKGFSIIGDGGVADYGIMTLINSSFSNITVKNFGNIEDFGRGISFYKSKNSQVSNNTISNCNDGIYFYPVDGMNAVISGNIILDNLQNGISFDADIRDYSYFDTGAVIDNNTLSNNLNGIYFDRCRYNNVTNNLIANNSLGIYIYTHSIGGYYINNTLSGNQEYGIYSHNNRVYPRSVITPYTNYFENNLISAGGVGMRIILSNNLFVASSVISGNDLGMEFGVSSNGLIEDTSLSGNKGYDVYASETTNNVTFLNCSYDTEYTVVGRSHSIYRKWYYQANVTDTNGNPRKNLKVIIYNTNNSWVANLTTGVDGLTSRYALTEYALNHTRNYSGAFYNNTLKGIYFSWNLTVQNNSVQSFVIPVSCWTYKNNLLFIPNSCGLVDLDEISEEII